MHVMRSVIFVPGIRENMIEKSRTVPADVICLDLEDSVPLAEKAQARETVARSIDALVEAGQTVHVRVNALDTGLTADDLAAVIRPSLSAVALPKTESAREMREMDVLLRQQEVAHGIKPGSVGVIPGIETALGCLRCEDIARATDRIIAITLGAEDYTNDLGVHRTREGDELRHLRYVVATVCHAYGVMALDTPYSDFRDEEGLVREAEWVKSIGFEGKYLIHPGQVEPVNRVFRPADEDVEQARRVVEAFRRGLEQGHAAVNLDGRMVDTPVARRAERLLATAEAIAERERRRVSTP